MVVKRGHSNKEHKKAKGTKDEIHETHSMIQDTAEI
jgi:hypothetical protein